MCCVCCVPAIIPNLCPDDLKDAPQLLQDSVAEVLVALRLFHESPVDVHLLPECERGVAIEVEIGSTRRLRLGLQKEAAWQLHSFALLVCFI